MEEFSQLGANLWGGLMCTTSPAEKTAVDAATVAMVGLPSGGAKGRCIPGPVPLLSNNYNQNSHLQAKHDGASSSSSHLPPSDVDAIKAKIVGAPPEVVARLSAVAQELEMRQRANLICRDSPTDPELDQFMEAYNEMLIKYREELTRPLQEAMEFLRRMESQLNSLALTTGSVPISSAGSASTTLLLLEAYNEMLIKYREELTRPLQEAMEFLRRMESQLNSLALTTGSVPISSAAEKFGVCSSGDDQDGNTDNAELPELVASAEDRELKHHLLKKYSGYLSSLRQELSKKKKKGKLPKDARQQLLNWWELHYKWPYPSETQKVALAEATGLDLKQINNWFINQRKRHWKPSEDMQFVVMDGYHAPNTALYMDGQYFMGDDLYRMGP
ncbi:hypothetical protein C4D60_Mb04t03090 [Musa balbisiana]|uniref:Homeobox domain-containing protein n=1 Tax=Musa balbisiana TaxID=52838 RepID=A0A4S8K9C9_MUSBA|nr:hypothetical protein C4D60_Mb04t03090 [Musa balbisiana]